MNKNHQIVMTENDVVNNWLCGNDIDHGVFADIDPINIYNNWCFNYDMEDKITPILEDTGDNFVERCTDIEKWYMPEEYKNIDIWNHILDLCPDDVEACARVTNELYEFEKRNMLPVLKFLVYLVDVTKKNNIVLGVGRGSSVASYCLYLLGVHRIDSIKYDLDIKEFLK